MTARVAAGLALVASVIASLIANPAAAATPYRWTLPPGFPEPPVPPDNPMSAEKVDLGRRLFFDTRLSVTGRYSCASCHDPARSFTDGRPVAIGALGDALPTNAMTLVNVAWNSSYGWTRPRVRTLEAQMRLPLFNQHPVELGLAGREAEVESLFRADEPYRAAFAAAFPDATVPVSIDNVIRAIASYERTLVSGNSPFDQYVYGGDSTALTAGAKRGLALFYAARTGCAGCHGGFNFTGTWREAGHDAARPAFARNGVGSRPMRIPTLRDLVRTAPYMHDGRFATLDEVLDHYVRMGAMKHAPDRRIQGFSLDADERADLLEFLVSLADAKQRS